MSRGAFETHLREAIALNRRRAPLYAEASGGASRSISRRLILSERLGLPLARWVDARAEPYHVRGIGVVRDLFVSMEETPPFLARVEPPQARFVPVRGREVARRLRVARRRGEYGAVAAAVEDEIAALPAGYHCMLRHILESLRRIATLAPGHARAAVDAGLPSPDPIFRMLLRTHLLVLGEAARLDARAAPLQARGIPIVCRDVPAIPARP